MSDVKKRLYGTSNDPVRGERHTLQSGGRKPDSLKDKQKKSVQDAMNPSDPVGNAVRGLYKKLRGK